MYYLFRAPDFRYFDIGFRVVVNGVEKRPRVLKGGSFGNFQKSTRSAYHSWFSPCDRFALVSFRVVVNGVGEEFTRRVLRGGTFYYDKEEVSHMLRGGSFFGNLKLARSARRLPNPPYFRGGSDGFRVAVNGTRKGIHCFDRDWVVRGGSFNSHYCYARCAFHCRGTPGVLGWSRGFRVVVNRVRRK